MKLRPVLTILSIAIVAWIIYSLAIMLIQKNSLSQKVESLKSAPESLLCEREMPTAISLNYYANEKAGWRAAFAGRNNKDFYLRFIQFSRELPEGQVTEFTVINGKWKYANELTPEERSEFRKTNTYSEEESAFLGFCIKQIYEYVEKREKRKRLYTPVAFFSFLQKPGHTLCRLRRGLDENNRFARMTSELNTKREVFREDIGRRVFGFNDRSICGFRGGFSSK